VAKTISPQEALVIISAGGVDVVDVREPNEYAEGHVAGARNVPLGDVKADPRRALPDPAVVLICAGGVRSQVAAELADGIGLSQVIHVEGGFKAWRAAGLPVVQPPRQTPGAAEPRGAASCGLPELGLEAIVGANIRTFRAQRNMTLDQLARSTGLSRTLLGQIELGKASASVSMVWAVAQAFDVHFSALLSTGERRTTRVLRRKDARRLVTPDGRYASRALYVSAEKGEAEFYELFLAGHSREDAQPHQVGTRENLLVTAGRLQLHVGEEQFELAQGDAILFSADVPHSYVNADKEECWMCLVMTYAAGP
jgi:rhodanese-related sulfurtransferase/transcriptional regulator with XRE-family HTH domain